MVYVILKTTADVQSVIDHGRNFYHTVARMLAAYRHWRQKQIDSIERLKTNWEKVRRKVVTKLALNQTKENKELLPKYNRLSAETRDELCTQYQEFKKR